MMIEFTYKEHKGKRQPSFQVRLEGKVIGEIRKVGGGFQYFPKGAKAGGEVLPTLDAVKRSLTEE